VAKKKLIKVADLEKGQRVRVESKNGIKEGDVMNITRDKDDAGAPAIWVMVGTPNGGFIETMHAPDGEIELAD
jgi:hypothetical protein